MLSQALTSVQPNQTADAPFCWFQRGKTRRFHHLNGSGGHRRHRGRTLFAVYPAENWSIRAPGNGEDQRLGCALTTEVGVEAPPQLGRINVDYIVLAAI